MHLFNPRANSFFTSNTLNRFHLVQHTGLIKSKFFPAKSRISLPRMSSFAGESENNGQSRSNSHILQDVKLMRSQTSGITLSQWFYDYPSQHIPHFPKLDETKEAQVVIVGAGIAGLTCAYTLAREGYNVVVLEDGEILSGETGRTTAHIMTAVDDKYFEIVKAFGMETGKLVYKSHVASSEYIEKIIKEEEIDCDFTWLDGYLIPSKSNGSDYIRKEYEAALQCGFQGVELVNNVPHTKFESGLSLKFPMQAQFHPVKYLSQLARIMSSKYGVKIFTNSSVCTFNEHEDYIETAEGFKVFYKNLIIATNVPVNDRFTMYTKMAPYRSYAISAKMKKGSHPLCLIWDTEEPYHYVRLAPDQRDPQSDIIIIGGEDHLVGEKVDIANKLKSLEMWSRERFPFMGPIENEWSGQVEEPVDMLYFLGRNPGSKQNVYIITGDSGTGMTSCTIGALIIRDMINGKDNDWARIYDPARKPISAISNFVSTNISANVKGLGPYLTGGEISDIEDIPNECGAVMRAGVSKVAVYRDKQGSIHKCSAVCPHLKAIVTWNDFEKSWDCPAHGSRFDPYGTVIHGPSKSNLKNISPISKM